MNLNDDPRLNGLKVALAYPMFVDQTQPVGWLTHDPACHACWWYYMLAMSHRAKAGKSIDDQIIEYEVGKSAPLWMDTYYGQQAKSIAMLYGLESPDQMFAHWSNVRLEARRLGMPDPADEIMMAKDRII